MATFRDRIQAAQDAKRSTLAVGLAPILEKIPYPMQRYDDPFFPFAKAIIDVTQSLACAYVFDLAAYLSIGASGAVALERSIAFVPDSLIKILHGPFASGDYVRLASRTGFAVDALTLDTCAAESIPRYVGVGLGIFCLGRHNELAQEMTEKYPNQVGEVAYEPDHTRLSLGCLSLHWYENDIAFASRGEFFREDARTAAEQRRDTP